MIWLIPGFLIGYIVGSWREWAWWKAAIYRIWDEKDAYDGSDNHHLNGDCGFQAIHERGAFYDLPRIGQKANP